MGHRIRVNRLFPKNPVSISDYDIQENESFFTVFHFKDNPFSLMTLSQEGPRIPFISTFINDMRNLMATPLFPRSGSDVMFSIREIMHNMRNASGDNRFDIYDFIPLFGVLFVTALVLAALFPNAVFLSGIRAMSEKNT